MSLFSPASYTFVDPQTRVSTHRNTASGSRGVAGLVLLLLLIIQQAEAQDGKRGRAQTAVGAQAAPADSIELHNMVFVRLPAGTFQMGSEHGDSDEQPVRTITIPQPLYMGRFEVTQEVWMGVMGSNPSYFEDPKRPVERVSWLDVQAFIRKLNKMEPSGRFRLPTEAEWEYAARAGSTTKWSFGDEEFKLLQHAWYSANSGGETRPAGQKRPNAWGLYDMYGNVWEWCQNWYSAGYYRTKPAKSPRGPLTGKDKVFRGGSWSSVAPKARSSYRDGGAPKGSDIDIGFRLIFVPK